MEQPESGPATLPLPTGGAPSRLFEAHATRQEKGSPNPKRDRPVCSPVLKFFFKVDRPCARGIRVLGLVPPRLVLCSRVARTVIPFSRTPQNLRSFLLLFSKPLQDTG